MQSIKYFIANLLTIICMIYLHRCLYITFKFLTNNLFVYGLYVLPRKSYVKVGGPPVLHIGSLLLFGRDHGNGVCRTPAGATVVWPPVSCVLTAAEVML